MRDPICAIQYSLLNQDHFIKDCWNFWLWVNLKRKCFDEITENVAHGKSRAHSGRKNNSFGLHCWESNMQLHSSGPVDRYSSLRYEELCARAGWRRILFIFKTPDTSKIIINKAIKFKQGCRLNDKAIEFRQGCRQNDKALGLRAFEIPADAFDHLFVWQSKVSAKSCTLMYSHRTVKVCFVCEIHCHTNSWLMAELAPNLVVHHSTFQVVQWCMCTLCDCL